MAKASPLAGYTVHPQGFCNRSTLQENAGLQEYFGRFKQLNLTDLSADKHDCYSLTENPTPSTLLPESVFLGYARF